MMEPPTVREEKQRLWALARDEPGGFPWWEVVAGTVIAATTWLLEPEFFGERSLLVVVLLTAIAAVTGGLVGHALRLLHLRLIAIPPREVGRLRQARHELEQELVQIRDFRPRIRAQCERDYNNDWLVRVHNEGAKAKFAATLKVLRGPDETQRVPGPRFRLFWEEQRTSEATIPGGGSDWLRFAFVGFNHGQTEDGGLIQQRNYGLYRSAGDQAESFAQQVHVMRNDEVLTVAEDFRLEVVISTDPPDPRGRWARRYTLTKGTLVDEETGEEVSLPQ